MSEHFEDPDAVRPDQLQFVHAMPVDGPAQAADAGPPPMFCVACKSRITDQYFHAQGQVVCPLCAERIAAFQQAPPAISLAKAALYGAGAAFAGFLLYALVGILLGLEIGFISILVGILVGKAVRKGSGGLGGRPQQFLAVALTYLAISTSSIPVAIYHMAKQPKTVESGQTERQVTPTPQAPALSLGKALATLFVLGVASPFLGLSTGVSGLLSLAIIGFGLLQAWRLTGRTELLVMGPYAVGGS